MAVARCDQIRSKCPISLGLDVFGDRWSLLILRDILFFQKRCYNEFLEAPEKISTNILAERLSRLETKGFLTRSRCQENRRKIFYSPTLKALDLLTVLIEIVLWGEDHEAESSALRDFMRRMRKEREDLILELRFCWKSRDRE